jgi:hypothetical protein
LLLVAPFFFLLLRTDYNYSRIHVLASLGARAWEVEVEVEIDIEVKGKEKGERREKRERREERGERKKEDG